MIGAITAGMLSGGTPVATNSYESIATVTVGAGGSSTITFSSIPSTYKHLELRAISRDGGGSNDFATPKFTFNSDTSSTYPRHYLYGNGSAASAGSVPTTGFAYIGTIAQGGTPANTFTPMVVDILDYANTNKYKTVRSLSGGETNSIGAVSFVSALWQSTSAITDISITSSSATNFAQYTTFALYGIKG